MVNLYSLSTVGLAIIVVMRFIADSIGLVIGVSGNDKLTFPHFVRMSSNKPSIQWETSLFIIN